MNDIKILTDVMNMYNSYYKSFGDYSVTQLIDSPRITALTKRYGHKIVRPVKSSVPSFIGSGVHLMFEKMLMLAKVQDSRYELERTITDKIEDRVITGRFDILYDYKHIFDIKTCKTWKTIFDPEMKDWTEQQNIYAWLLYNRGISVETINVIAVYLDWIESKAIRDKDYPQSGVVQYQLELWPQEKTKSFVMGKINTLIKCESLSDENLPLCTSDEMWARFEGGAEKQYAVMKNSKAIRATRVFNTLIDAQNYCAENRKKLQSDSFIEVRHPQRKRCEEYCLVNQWCNEYISYIYRKKNDNLNDIIPIQ